MDYTDYNDNELLLYISENNEDACEIIFKKYEPLIKTLSNKMFKYCYGTSLELSDLYQEGMLALNLAVNSFDGQKNIRFSTFARKCIERRIASTIISSRRQKHKFLNESVSLEFSNDERYKLDILLKDSSSNPENVLVEYEQNELFLNNLKEQLTSLEVNVLDLKLDGFSYNEIASILGKNRKCIDNAVQRIRLKAKFVMKQLETA